MDSESDQDYIPKHSNNSPNAADQFRDNHQAEHEKRHNEPPGLCHRVESHNDTYPKLKQQLDKRRSDSKPTALSLRQGRGNGSNQSLGRLGTLCSSCARLEAQRRRTNKTSDRRRQPAKVIKKRRPQRKLVIKHSAKPVTARNKRTEAARDKRREDQEPETSGNCDNQRPAPGSQSSIASYHSFISMDREPMG